MILLDDVMEALEETDMYITHYYNKRTNQILYSNQFDSEFDTYTEDDEFNDDVILMFDYRDKNDYALMQEFIGTIENDELRNQFYTNTRGKEAFKRFRNLLYCNEITNDWYQFKEARYREIALDWCNQNHIKYYEKEVEELI